MALDKLRYSLTNSSMLEGNCCTCSLLRTGGIIIIAATVLEDGIKIAINPEITAIIKGIFNTFKLLTENENTPIARENNKAIAINAVALPTLSTVPIKYMSQGETIITYQDT